MLVKEMIETIQIRVLTCRLVKNASNVYKKIKQHNQHPNLNGLQLIQSAPTS